MDVFPLRSTCNTRAKVSVQSTQSKGQMTESSVPGDTIPLMREFPGYGISGKKLEIRFTSGHSTGGLWQREGRSSPRFILPLSGDATQRMVVRSISRTLMRLLGG